MTISKVFIVGAGLMGSGIAQVCAQAGINVLITDINQEILNRALKNIAWSVSKLIEKGKVKESLETIMGRIRVGTDWENASQVDLVIEAVFEKLELKHKIFKKLDEVCGPETVLATNTSAIPITEIAAVSKRPEKVLGLHFFSPVPMMEAVEVIKGVRTSEETMRAGVDFVRSIGKDPIRVESDVPGFLLNRIHLVGYLEAIHLLKSHLNTP